MHSDEMARCLAECDVQGVRRLAKYVWPHHPQPRSDHETLAAIHYARTVADSFAPRLRFYSHRWLLDNGIPSGLPDDLKPKAERMYPRVQEGVGISVRGTSEVGRAIAPIVQGAMSDAVLDAYADIKSPDPVFVKRRMMEARKGVIKKLIGR